MEELKTDDSSTRLPGKLLLSAEEESEDDDDLRGRFVGRGEDFLGLERAEIGVKPTALRATIA